MKSLIPALMILACLSNSSVHAVRAATTVIQHAGSSEPSTEGWTVLASPDVQFGGNELTSSGVHEFWHIEHAPVSGARSTVEYTLSSAQLNTDWIFQARVRVIDSPPIDNSDTPITAVGVRDNRQWAFSLGNDRVGIASNTEPMSFSALRDTRSDYHLYEIDFHQNGPTTIDDTADFYYDGSLLFAGVNRTQLALGPVSDTVIWGPVSGFAIESDANYEYVSFVPEPASFAGFFVLIATHLSRRRSVLIHS